MNERDERIKDALARYEASKTSKKKRPRTKLTKTNRPSNQKEKTSNG